MESFDTTLAELKENILTLCKNARILWEGEKKDTFKHFCWDGTQSMQAFQRALGFWRYWKDKKKEVINFALLSEQGKLL